LLDRAKKIGDIIRKCNEIHIVSHIDADGMSAGAIAYQTLVRMNKDYSIEFVRQVDDSLIERLQNRNYELVWFTDLGSSIAGEYGEFNKIITDHHVCPDNSDFDFHLNPHLFNIDGATEISGSGTTYLVSKAIDKRNVDLSALAVVGACGDLQDRKNRKLLSLNKKIVNDGISIGTVNPRLDIRYFGRETRSVIRLLQYASDPVLPGLSGRENACIQFLQNLGIQMKDGDSWRRWIDLNRDERKIIISNIAKLLLNKGFGYKNTIKIVGEVYLFEKEKEGLEVHEAKEFATLLNSTARYDKFDIGLQVCLGDRGEYLSKAQNLLSGHRANLIEGLQFVREEGIIKRSFIQYFHAKSGVKDTIVGIVTNMLLHSGDVCSDIPLIGLANKNDNEIKVSARATQELVDRGLNLSKAMKKSASSLNGVGGGHNIAAGATIPKGKEEEFLDLIEKEIKNQISS
jgi:RecJ-like exonuclease